MRFSLAFKHSTYKNTLTHLRGGGALANVLLNVSEKSFSRLFDSCRIWWLTIYMDPLDTQVATTPM